MGVSPAPDGVEEHEVEPTEVAIVEGIFREFLAGQSPRQIAKMLNREGIAGPFGGKWSPSTLYGNITSVGERGRACNWKRRHLSRDEVVMT